MAKGLFSQCFCLLTDGTPTLADLKSALQDKDFEIVKSAPPQKDWRFGGPTLVVAYLPEDNGYAAVDVVNHPWPDTMGDPKSDPMTFGAWGTGHFGPFTFPGGLERASQQSWDWPDGKKVAPAHKGFVRLRLSYAFGAKDKDPILPEDYSPLAELLFLTDMALPLLKVPGVLCYFNPNGEVLRDRATYREVRSTCKKQEQIPLPLWMNVRLFNINERLSLMDTVGNGQLDLKDVEAVFPRAKHDPNDIASYLRVVTGYLMGLDREMESGEEIDGPGESDLSWTTELLKQGASPPPRRVLRLYPKALRKEIRALAEAGS
jgi:Domain of unknown function (DUF4261)